MVYGRLFTLAACWMVNKVSRQMATEIETVLIKAFCDKTGYTDKAVRRKIESGVWREGEMYVKSPDGHIQIIVEAYNKWVKGELNAA